MASSKIDIYIPKTFGDSNFATIGNLARWNDAGRRVDGFFVVVCDDRDIVTTRTGALSCPLAQRMWNIHTTVNELRETPGNLLIVASGDRMLAMRKLDALVSRGAVPLADMRSDGDVGDETFRYVRGKHVEIDRHRDGSPAIRWIDMTPEIRNRIVDSAIGRMYACALINIRRALFTNWPLAPCSKEEAKIFRTIDAGYSREKFESGWSFIKSVSFGRIGNEYKERAKSGRSKSNLLALNLVSESALREIIEAECADFEFVLLAIQNCWIDAFVKHPDEFPRKRPFKRPETTWLSQKELEQMVEKGCELGVDVAIEAIVDKNVPIPFEVERPIGWFLIKTPSYVE